MSGCVKLHEIVTGVLFCEGVLCVTESYNMHLLGRVPCVTESSCRPAITYSSEGAP